MQAAEMRFLETVKESTKRLNKESRNKIRIENIYSEGQAERTQKV